MVFEALVTERENAKEPTAEKQAESARDDIESARQRRRVNKSSNYLELFSLDRRIEGLRSAATCAG